MNKHIKDLIEANIFKDKAFNQANKRAAISRAAQDLSDKYRWMGAAIFDAYKQVKGRSSIAGIQDVMQKISAKDTFMIPYASFNVL